MSGNTLRHKVERLLASADVEIGGDRPWDIQIFNNGFYARVLSGGSLALGESYMDGWWDCDRLDEFFYRILRARLDSMVQSPTWFFYFFTARLFNFQRPSRAYQVGRHHYDIGINLYQGMLDKRLIYSCGYWENASSLEEAQAAKLNLVCRKLGLQPGMRVLDIGCGWGGSAKFVAEQYQVEVVGITVSEQQANYGKDLCRGLPVDIHLRDYREIEGSFDRVLSLGMFEHVGYKNYANYMRLVRNCLKEEGLFLLHTIGRNRSAVRCEPWVERYIFPNSMVPSAKQVCSAIEEIFVVEDWHSFGTDYDKTLMEWFRNFHESWPGLKESYGERFYRMWKYWLLSSAGSFRARRHQLWQLVLSPEGVPGGYKRPRHHQQ